MRFANESTVSFTPDHSGTWAVRFTAHGHSWTEPVVGWAVVVTNPDDGEEGASTQVQPVVIDPAEGWPASITEYRNNRDGYVAWRMERA